MTEEVVETVNALQKRLEEDGLTLYSRRLNDVMPTLVMFDTRQKKFVIIAFSPEEVGVYSQVDVYLTIAESKAEVLGMREVSPYRVDKDSREMWVVLSDGATM